MEIVLFFVISGIIFIIFRRLFFDDNSIAISKQERVRRREFDRNIEKKQQEIDNNRKELDSLTTEYIDKNKLYNTNSYKYETTYCIHPDDIFRTTVMNETEFGITKPNFTRAIKISEHPVCKFIIDLGFDHCDINPPSIDTDLKYKSGILPFQLKLMRYNRKIINKKPMKFRVNNN